MSYHVQGQGWQLHEIEMLAGSWNDLEPGTCFRMPLDSDRIDERYGENWRSRLSPEFQASGRDFVWQIVVPGHAIWCPDFLSSRSERGWVVTGGTVRDLSAHPSVNVEGVYHGWLQNGWLSEDVEGRRFS